MGLQTHWEHTRLHSTCQAFVQTFCTYLPTCCSNTISKESFPKNIKPYPINKCKDFHSVTNSSYHNLSLSLSLWLSVYTSRRWMPSVPVPWVHPCWRGHAPSLQPRRLSNARRLALRAWSWSGAKMPATRTLVLCLPMTWSTHYRWRTRTTGGVHTRQTYTPLTPLFTSWYRLRRGPVYCIPDHVYRVDKVSNIQNMRIYTYTSHLIKATRTPSLVHTVHLIIYAGSHSQLYIHFSALLHSKY